MNKGLILDLQWTSKIGNNKQSINTRLVMDLQANLKTQKQNVHNKDNQFLDLRIEHFDLQATFL
jgi:hypothetical protein